MATTVARGSRLTLMGGAWIRMRLTVIFFRSPLAAA
jgi:hypothetical protein